MVKIKFRQPIISFGKFYGWHYWGFVDGKFVSPGESPDRTVADSQKQSQQFTGLKDRNGKEIYEGDILRHVNSFSKRYQVFPRAGGPVINVFSDELQELKTTWEALADQQTCAFVSQCCEVIGNIYESPKLLIGEA